MRVCVCVHLRGRVIYLGRQVGCCEELIMVQQSGARRPCFSLIMGFHSLVHRLQMEPRCIRRGMGFHTQAHTVHSHTHTLRIRFILMVQHSCAHTNIHNQPHTNTTICPCAYRAQQLYSKHIEKNTNTPSPSCSMAHAACMVCCLRSAANFSPCGSLISASHNCPLIRSNRFFSLGINCVFFLSKSISFPGIEMVFYFGWHSSGESRLIQILSF